MDAARAKEIEEELRLIRALRIANPVSKEGARDSQNYIESLQREFRNIMKIEDKKTVQPSQFWDKAKNGRFATKHKT